MPPANTPPPTAPPDDPVRAAVADPALHAELTAQARSRLGRLLSDRPVAVRQEEAAEAVQEAIRRALSNAAKFDPALASAAAWVHGILNNVLSERCRAIRKRPAQPESDPDGWDSLLARFDSSADAGELARVLDRLPEEQRGIVVLHHIDGLSHEEIAGRLGITESCARMRLSRAMGELKRIASGSGEGGR